MKVKTILIIILIVIIGLFCSIGLGFFNTDTDTDNQNIIGFDETFDVIYIRQHPKDKGLYLFTCYKYDPVCGCDDEFTITVKLNQYKTLIENINTPAIIKISGYIINGVYNIEIMEVKK